ncbi:MAG: hypothetical protein ABSC06_20080 [Rhodopila sp.]|jgi:hypothetical protein
MTITVVDSTRLGSDEVFLLSETVPGGTVYMVANQSGLSGLTGAGSTFVPISAGGLQRTLALTSVKTDAGVPVTAAPSATTFGIARTAGASLSLFGATTSGAATVTTKGIWEFNLPDSYVAGAAIPVVVDAVVPTAADVTALATTMTLAAYTESPLGAEAALTVTSALEIPVTTAAPLAFTITGTGLAPAQRVVLELTMAVTTTAGGASFGQVNSVAYQA